MKTSLLSQVPRSALEWRKEHIWLYHGNSSTPQHCSFITLTSWLDRTYVSLKAKGSLRDSIVETNAALELDSLCIHPHPTADSLCYLEQVTSLLQIPVTSSVRQAQHHCLHLSIVYPRQLRIHHIKQILNKVLGLSTRYYLNASYDLTIL